MADGGAAYAAATVLADNITRVSVWSVSACACALEDLPKGTERLLRGPARTGAPAPGPKAWALGPDACCATWAPIWSWKQ